MQCNTPLMNSWHSFSPNGRWLVFSSKSRSPYTQMFLTHLDKDGNDSPAILIENTTAANRAVNIPEFVNMPADGLMKIDTPATDFYRLSDGAWELSKAGQVRGGHRRVEEGAGTEPGKRPAHNNVGLLLVAIGQFGEAIPHFEKALTVNPEYPDGSQQSRRRACRSRDRSIGRSSEFEKALEINPAFGRSAQQPWPGWPGRVSWMSIRVQGLRSPGFPIYGNAELAERQVQRSHQFQKALELRPEVHNSLAVALGENRATGRGDRTLQPSRGDQSRTSPRLTSTLAIRSII